MIRQVAFLAVTTALLLFGSGVLRAEPPSEKVPPEAAAKQFVTVQVTVYEVNRTKLRALGFDWDLVASDGKPSPEVPDVMNFKFATGKQLDGFLQALKQYSLGEVITRPTLQTLSGQPATVDVGSDTHYVKLEVVPNVLESGRIRVQHRLDLCHSGVKLKSDSTVEVEPGQAAIASHIPSERKDAAGKVTETTLLVVVRADTEQPTAGDTKTTAVPSTVPSRR